MLSMIVVASKKQREELKKENEELIETNTFLIEDLRRREVQLNSVQEELEKYKAMYEKEKLDKEIQVGITHSHKMALDQKDIQYNEAHNNAVESAALAQKQAMSMEILRARLVDQTKQLDAYIENPMTIPGSQEEQVAVSRSRWLSCKRV